MRKHSIKYPELTRIVDMAIIGSMGFVKIPSGRIIVRAVNHQEVVIRKNPDDTTVRRTPGSGPRKKHREQV